jgi:hypothetical protein
MGCAAVRGRLKNLPMAGYQPAPLSLGRLSAASYQPALLQNSADSESYLKIPENYRLTRWLARTTMSAAGFGFFWVITPYR